MEQPLPCDVEAERSFLASVAAPGNDDEAYLLLPSVRQEDFVVPLHREIHAGLVKLVDSRTEISSITLRHAMGVETGSTAHTQTLDVLNSEELGRPSVLADILRRHTLNRKIIKIGGHLVNEGYRNLEPHEVASRATEALRNLEHDRKGRINATHILARVENGEAFAEPDCGAQNVKWGLPVLTDNIEASPGHVVVIGARPKCGKSALAIQVATESAKRGISSLFVSLEMDTDEVESRLAANLTGTEYGAFRKKTYGDNDQAILHDEAHLLHHIEIWAKPSGISLSDIEVEIRDSVRRDSTRLVIIDYFQLIAHPMSKNLTEASALGANVNKLKRIAQELKITILLLVQVNREGAGRSEPSSADLKGSGDLEQTANAIVLLWRDAAEEIHMKISDNRSGPAGFRQIVHFDGATNRFRQIERTT